MESCAAVWLCVMWWCWCGGALVCAPALCPNSCTWRTEGSAGSLLAFRLIFSLNALVVLAGQQAPVSHHPSHPLGLEMYTTTPPCQDFPWLLGRGTQVLMLARQTFYWWASSQSWLWHADKACRACCRRSSGNALVPPHKHHAIL